MANLLSLSLALNVVSWYVWTAQRALPAAILRYFCVCVKLLLFSLLTKGKIVRYWNVCFKFCFQCKFEEVWATISSFRPYRGKKGSIKVSQDCNRSWRISNGFSVQCDRKNRNENINKTETVRNGTLIACCDCAVKSFVSAGVFRILAL